MKNLYRGGIILLLLWSLFACNSGEIAMGGGIGGTGVTSDGGATVSSDIAAPEVAKVNAVHLNIGVVTQLNPLVVNDITYDLQTATIMKEEQSVGMESLRLGMVIRANSSAFDPVARTATANLVHLSVDLRGAVQTISLNNHQLSVLRQAVWLDNATVFDGIQLTAIQTGTLLMISGLTDAQGQLHATYVAAATSDELSKVSGAVDQLDEATQTFTIGGLIVNYSNLQTFQGELAVGKWAVAQGTLVDNRFIASHLLVEEVSQELTEGTEIVVDGIMTELKDDGTFSIARLSALVTTETIVSDNLVLASNTRLRVKGHFSGEGALIAEEIEVVND